MGAFLDNFNDLLPIPPAGRVNIQWQADPPGVSPRNISAHVAVPGSAGTVASVVEIEITAPSAAPFSVAHGLSTTPSFVLIQMKSGGSIWLQTPLMFDGSYIYLAASHAGLVATLIVWTSPADTQVSVTSTAGGNLTVPHVLGVPPALALVTMTSPGAFWFQATPWDASNLNLVASGANQTALVQAWAVVPSITIARFKKLALAPGVAGNFTVAHGFGRTPEVVFIRMSSSGLIWLQTPTGFDGTNLFMVASDASVTGEAEIWG